ncbi:MAG: coenzyme F420 hydrogenase subunit alpha [Methanobrevibacter sp.]|uniref:Coenzyme F420 hydrogenase subunit alpha n=1 Tax=Methanobrevibacter millerae TaxID=230361 RepID=A0A8T3VTT0_9EURY|nr:coenzyme F420 hydrogenase subunit alpha [Methanobrevibacter sp.]MBE6511009.1 coenzyme F420 hydrogenase subunit alpha [Methanobrevibacter millerae]MBO5152621.1 coenzyme F420 hydrogenase subunit alpha [Methanobrevibacter sp.]
MKDRVVISPTTRQEGHAELVMEVDDEGIVTKGMYLSITPVRGLEKMVLNKAPETAPVLCQRICGVCPIPHTLASTEAIDMALGIEIPKTAKLLRKATLAAHNINSAAIHHFLVAPDITDDSNFAQAVDSVSEIRKNVQYVVDMIAGEGIHPSDIRVGGMARNITPFTKERLVERMTALRPKLEAHVEFIKNLVLEAGLPKDLGVVNQPLMAVDPLYGTNDFDMDKFSEVLPEAWYDDPEIGTKACSVIPLWEGTNVETGPRARMEKYQGFKDKGVIAQHVARADEMLKNYDACMEALDAIDPAASVKADYDPRGTGELGFGIIEGPRGTNAHMAKVVDGKTAFYSAIVPTTWNIPTMGPATEGFHHEFGPHVIRAYDPCLSCATHVMVVDDEDKSILKNEMVRI